jgi:hypothetical protein
MILGAAAMSLDPKAQAKDIEDKYLESFEVGKMMGGEREERPLADAQDMIKHHKSSLGAYELILA